MKRLFLVVLTLFATSAFAIGLGNDNRGGEATATAIAGASVSSRIDNDVRANAAAFQAQGQKQSAVAGNSLQINVPQELANKTITNRVETNDYKIATVPNVFGGNVYPTAPCMGSSQIGGAGIGFGFSIGSSWTDDECGIRETARSFNSFGMKEDAVKVLCSSKYAAVAPACKGN